MGMIVYSKVCTICDLDTPELKPIHDCSKNWFGSSESMECNGALDILNKIWQQYNKLVFLENFLSDDDSTTRATLSLKQNK